MFDPDNWHSRVRVAREACLAAFNEFLETENPTEWGKQCLILHQLLREIGLDKQASIQRANIKRNETFKARGIKWGRPKLQRKQD